MYRLIAFWLMLAGLSMGPAAFAQQTYYVSPGGSDGQTGLSQDQPWQTVSHALNTIEAGDTIVLLPGIYRESVNVRFAGSPDVTTTIKAAEPGTAILSGSLPLDTFQRVAGTSSIYVTTLSQSPREVKELDTNQYLVPCPDLESLSLTAGSYFYDAQSHRLYVHCTDGDDPAGHALIAKLFGLGLYLGPEADGDRQVHRVHITGLVVHGFAEAGIKITGARHCRVDFCRVYDTGWGIDFWSAQDTEVTDCILYRNGDSAPFSEGGHVSFRGSTMQGNAIRRCIAFDGRHQGLRFYAGRPEPGQADHAEATDNLAYNNVNSGVWFKSALLSDSSLIARNVAVGRDYLEGSSTVVLRGPTSEYNTKISTINSAIYPDPDTLAYPNSAAGKGDLQVNRRTLAESRFVDPIRHDYRLQADSPLRGQGPSGSDLGAHQYADEVYFVSPDGDDNNLGTSLRQAWQTLEHAARQAQPGHTIYVTAGTYHASLRPARNGQPDRPIVFRARGHDRVILSGQAETNIGINLHNRQHIVIEGFEITGYTTAGIALRNSQHIEITDCVLRQNPGFGVQITDSQHSRIHRNTFWENRNRQMAIGGTASHVSIDSNLFTGSKMLLFSTEAVDDPTLYCDHNAFEQTGAYQYAFRAAGVYAQHLDQWQAMTGYDIRSRHVSPNLNNPAAGDFRPAANSPLNARGRYALGIGARKAMPRQEPQLAITNVQVQALTPRTATITWHTPSVNSTTSLRFGQTPELENARTITDLKGTYHYVSLTDLEPGTTYYFQPYSVSPPYTRHSNPELARADAALDRDQANGPIMLFTTPTQWTSPRTFHVDPRGDNANDGLTPQTAWRTPARAVLEVQAGDTVLFAGGRYYGPLEPITSGTADRPITFKAIEGQRAELHGYASAADSACLRVRGLKHLIFEGFDFTGGNSRHQVALDTVDHITLRRCLFSSRSRARVNAMIGHEVGRLRVEDTVFTRTAYPIRIPNSPDLDVVFDHCHFGIHGFTNMSIRSSKRFEIKNSVLVSNSKLKTGTLPWLFFHDDHQGFAAHHNLFWVMPYDTRQLFAAQGSNFYDPRTYTRTWEGLEQWQSAGYGANSLVVHQARLNRYSGHSVTPTNPTYQWEDFIAAQDSPAIGAAQNGDAIGPRPYARFSRRATGVEALATQLP